MNTLKQLLFFLIVVISRTKVSSFNIETRNPIVKRGLPSNYFGFSVAQHVEKADSKNQNEYWILVGAPLGKNLQPNTNRSGALFKCPVSNDASDCEQVETDGKRFGDFNYGDEEEDSDTLKPPGNDEIKEDQWLGVTIKSQKPGGRVAVCAHRYIQSPNLTLYHYGVGLCYLLRPDLEADELLEPCKGRPVEKLHQQFGYCQIGTSLTILNDGYAVIGAPGPFTWRGTIFAKDVATKGMDTDETVYHGPLNDNPYPIDKYSYLGMSVTGGHFFEKGIFTYASGAPRSNFFGQVFFFKKTKNIDDMSIRLIINGSQFASSFGYEILAVDIDNDGYDELLVAAPFYYENSRGGAVYLYKNLTKCTNISCEPSSNFTGKAESRFGFSMSSLGDINKDGYTDVAIGAPYQGEGGAVYIYLGNKDGLNMNPSQIITPPAHQGAYGIKTLGYSMSGGIDMDLNDYPDLLVGAYESDMVILYKTRPIIDINITVSSSELNNINATKKGCIAEPDGNKTCFGFTTCFTLSHVELSGQEVYIKYSIEEIPKRIPRVKFLRTKSPKYITVNDTSRSYCEEEVVDLIEGNGDILSPIQFKVNYSIDNDTIGSPILNKTSVKMFKATFQKDCGDDDICNSNLTLLASAPLTESKEGYVFDMGKKKELLVEVNVINSGESAYEAKLFVVHPKDLSYVALQVEKDKHSNAICTSNNESTIVICGLGNPFQRNQGVNLRLRFEVTDTKMQKLDLKIFVNSTSHELSKQTSQSFTVVIQKIANYIIKGDGRPQNIFYSGEIKGDSAMKYLEDIGPRVVHSYNLINQGEWNMQGMQVLITWPYEVFTNRGEGGKRLLYLEAQPVIEVNNEKTKCLVNPPNAINPLKLDSSGIEEDIRDDGLKPGEGSEHGRRKRHTLEKSRWRRDVEEVVKAENVEWSDGKKRRIVSMDCARGTARCANITCDIRSLSKNTQIKINITSRVWNSTLMEDYSDVDWVSLTSVARVLINDPLIIHSNDTIMETSIETKAYPAVTVVQPLNIWIIVGAVLAGLLLLIIIIIILCKCGFFKRHRVNDRTLSGNLKKQGESETLLKENEAKPTKSVS